MSFQSNEFEFFGEMNKNIDYYLLDSNSSEEKELIKSKINKYKTTSEFYEYFTNYNILSLFETIDQLDEVYSNIYGKNNNIKSKIDKYISDLSYIILLFNLISKNQAIIEKALTNSESYLKNFYSENNINIDDQKKFEKYFDSLMNSKKRKKKKSFLNHENHFNKKERHKSAKHKKTNIFILNRKTEEKNINFNCNLINISPPDNNLNVNLNEEKSITDLTTPQFPYKINADDNNYYNQGYNREIGSDKNAINKQESIQSFYTLAPNKASINQEEKKDIKLKSNNKDLNKKVIFKEEKITDFNLNNMKSDCDAKLVYSKSNNSEKMKEEKKGKNYESKEPYIPTNPRKVNFSSINLKSTMEKNMLKNFLGFINNIYKNGYINNEEKIKIKELIISKSEKIQNLYSSYYTTDEIEFIKELKKLTI